MLNKQLSEFTSKTHHRSTSSTGINPLSVSTNSASHQNQQHYFENSNGLTSPSRIENKNNFILGIYDRQQSEVKTLASHRTRFLNKQTGFIYIVFMFSFPKKRICLIKVVVIRRAMLEKIAHPLAKLSSSC